jgi:hypothetical protein
LAKNSSRKGFFSLKLIGVGVLILPRNAWHTCATYGASAEWDDTMMLISARAGATAHAASATAVAAAGRTLFMMVVWC